MPLARAALALARQGTDVVLTYQRNAAEATAAPRPSADDEVL